MEKYVQQTSSQRSTIQPRAACENNTRTNLTWMGPPSTHGTKGTCLPLCNELSHGSSAKWPHHKEEQFWVLTVFQTGQTENTDQRIIANKRGTRALIVLECDNTNILPKTPNPVLRVKCHALTPRPKTASKLPILFLGCCAKAERGS